MLFAINRFVVISRKLLQEKSAKIHVICGRKKYGLRYCCKKKAPADLTDSRKTKSAKVSVSAGEKLLAINYFVAS